MAALEKAIKNVVASARTFAEKKEVYLQMARQARGGAKAMVMPTESEWRGLSASEIACYRWPDDTPEHRALRAAFVKDAMTADKKREKFSLAKWIGLTK